jgi:hypothetical protein
MFVSSKPVDHKRLIELLARQFGAPIDEVALLYEQEREALEAHSRVKAFVPVLVARHIRDLLSQRMSNQTGGILNAA